LTTTNLGDKDSVPHNSAEKMLHLDLLQTPPVARGRGAARLAGSHLPR